jgi:hypothetical protein
MTFELFCMGLIALFVGMAIAFNGYRWFLILLPIFGFVFGFGLGLDTMQSLFGAAMFGTVTGWVVGFIVGLVFAVLSYLFYIVGVALIGGAFGYAIGVGLMGLIGFNPGFLTWVVGMVVGIAVAFAVLALNIQKWAIIAITAFGGAGVIIGTFMAMFGVIKPELFGAGAVKLAMQNSPLWLISFLVLGILGFVAQFYSTRNFELTPPPDRF